MRTYTVTLSGVTEADAIKAALALARQDEFSVVRIVDTLRAGDGWQVILEVTPLRGSLDPAA